MLIVHYEEIHFIFSPLLEILHNENCQRHPGKQSQIF